MTENTIEPFDAEQQAALIQRHIEALGVRGDALDPEIEADRAELAKSVKAAHSDMSAADLKAQTRSKTRQQALDKIVTEELHKRSAWKTQHQINYVLGSLEWLLKQSENEPEAPAREVTAAHQAKRLARDLGQYARRHTEWRWTCILRKAIATALRDGKSLRTSADAVISRAQKQILLDAQDGSTNGGSNNTCRIASAFDREETAGIANFVDDFRGGGLRWIIPAEFEF